MLRRQAIIRYFIFSLAVLLLLNVANVQPLAITIKAKPNLNRQLAVSTLTGRLAQSPATVGQAVTGTAARLTTGQILRPALAVGQTHSYTVALAAGDYLVVALEQQGIALTAKLLDAQGNTLLETNSASDVSFTERVHFIAPQPGIYQLTVVGVEKTGLNSGYQLTVKELRAATAQDASIVTTEKLVTQARTARQQHKMAEAVPLLEMALAQQQQIWPAGHPVIADTLQLLGQSLQGAPNLARSEQLLQQSLALRERLLGPDHPDVGNSLEALGGFYYQKADYRQLEAIVRRTLAVRERTLGINHIGVAQALSNLAFLLQDKGEYETAEELFKRSLTSYQQVLGTQHQAVTNVLDNLAFLYQVLGDYQRAEPLFRRSIEIQEAILGEDNLDFAISLNNLGGLYSQKADYEQAERYFKRGIAILEKLFGAENHETATAINNLASLYLLKGDVGSGIKLLQRSLVIFEKAFGTQHPRVATALVNLAGAHKLQGNYDLAEQQLSRALDIQEKLVASGGDQQPLALVLNNLGELEQLKKNYDLANQLFERSLAIREKQLGRDNLTVANTLANWGHLARLQGHYELAAARLQRCLTIREQRLGDAHPNVADALGELAAIYEAQGDITTAAPYRIQANEAREREILRNLATGSESQKLQYLALTADETNFTLSLHLQGAPQNLALGRAALTVLLRRKGRALDAMTAAIGLLRQRATAEDRQLLDELARLRDQIATLANRGPGRETLKTHQARLQRLSEQAEELENQISARSALLGQQLQFSHQPITLEAVQQAIPHDTVLLEFATYRPFQAANNQYLPARYAVYLLENQGPPKFVDLGTVDVIDAAVQALRQQLVQAPARRGSARQLLAAQNALKTAARNLDQLLLQPVRPLLGAHTRLLISPDRALNLVPFDALVDPQRQYLVQRYEISYLTSGRDLLRFQTNQAALPTTPPVILANPDYGQGDGPKLLGQTLGRLQQLSGAAAEGQQLQTILPQAQFLTGAAANETLIRQIERPLLLHIATHGYFLQTEENSSADNSGTRALVFEQNRNPDVAALSRANPLLRSYLFFAGANQAQASETLTAPAAGNPSEPRPINSQSGVSQTNANQTNTSQTSANQISANANQSSTNQPELNLTSVNAASADTSAANVVRTKISPTNSDLPNNNDGVMTALEMANLNLLGTKLVVLSACNTGLGEVRDGDGVYGLRRALVLAGSESQMMSLWPVADQATRQLMVQYYRALQQGAGRSAALRQVRLQLLRRLKTRHPYYWASFIQSGEWANLAGKR